MNKKKKILFLVTQSEFGGAQHFIYTLVINLKNYDITVAAGRRGSGDPIEIPKNYDITVGTAPKGSGTIKEQKLTKYTSKLTEGTKMKGLLYSLEKRRINTKYLKYLRRGVNPFFDFFLGLIEIYKLIKKEKPDILFLCSSKAGAMGSLVGRLAKVPKIIYRIGGWTFNDPRSFLIKAYYKFIEKVSAKWKHVIINNAESDRKQAIKLGIKPKEKILTIHNGVDVDELNFFSKEVARGLLGIKPGFIIGTIANFYPAKGLEYLIEAGKFMKEKDIKFILIGEGQERKKLKKLINKYNLEKNFLLPGDIPEAYKYETYKYLKAFDIFVLPSIKEGFPWTIIEAMAAEVPVIATKVGAIPEVIQNNKSGILVESRDSKGLAEAIKKLIDNKDLREKFSRDAKKIVEKKFNLKQMIKKYENLFSDN